MAQQLSNNTNLLKTHASIIQSLEQKDVKRIQAVLGTAAGMFKLDFAAVFDHRGFLQESFPQSIQAAQLEQFLQDRNIPQLIQQYRQGQIKATEADQNGFFRFDATLLAGLGLGHRDISGKGAVCLLSFGFILDDFHDLSGVCLTGLILNQYHAPFTRLHEKTGSVALMYLDQTPAAYGGFKLEPESAPSLQLSSNILAEIQHAADIKHYRLNLSGQNFFAACSSLKTIDHENAGVICVGAPG